MISNTPFVSVEKFPYPCPKICPCKIGFCENLSINVPLIINVFDKEPPEEEVLDDELPDDELDDELLDDVLNLQTLKAWFVPANIDEAASTAGFWNPPDFPIPVGGRPSINTWIAPLAGCPEESYWIPYPFIEMVPRP